MKIVKWISSILISISILSCNNSNFENIDGYWIAEGYSCEDKIGLTERIKISKDKNKVFAVKSSGDNCIKEGDTTWFGEVQNGKIIGRLKGVNPRTKNYEWTNCNVYKNSGFLYLSVGKYLVLKMRKEE